MTTPQIMIMLVIAIYLGMMVIIGAIYSKQTNNVGDFYLGGRRLGPLVTAMSAEASDMSSYLLMGLPGLAYLTGIADVGWTVIGLATGTYLNWLFVAKKLRNYSAHCEAITLPEFFSKRYREKSHVLMAIAAIMIVIFFIPYTGSGFAACGKLFGTLFGIDYHIAMIVSAIIIVGYTSLGGFNAASMTDLIQSIIMTIALIIVLVFGVKQAGGVESVVNNAQQFNGYLNMFQTHDPATNTSSPYTLFTICSTLAWGLGYFGMPHILLRFMAIEDPKKVKTSRRVASVWVVISMAIAVLIGIVGKAMVSNGVIDALPENQHETIIVVISNFLASNFGVFAAIIAGVILSGILASTMSTADSQLLAASSAVSENIFGGLFGIKLKEKTEVIIARTVLIVIAIIGVFIAWNPDSSIFKIVSFAWAGFGAVFGPVMLLALFWKRSNKYGAIAGMLTGGIMVFVWKFIIAVNVPALAVYELLPAFVIAIVVNIVVSLITPAPEKEITDEFEEVKKLNKEMR